MVEDSGPPSMYSAKLLVTLFMIGIAVRILPGTNSGVSMLLVDFHSSPGTVKGFTEIRGSI